MTLRTWIGLAVGTALVIAATLRWRSIAPAGDPSSVPLGAPADPPRHVDGEAPATPPGAYDGARGDPTQDQRQAASGAEAQQLDLTTVVSVVDTVTGAPIPGARLLVAQLTGEVLKSRLELQTNEGGNVTFTRAASIPARVRATSKGYRSTEDILGRGVQSAAIALQPHAGSVEGVITAARATYRGALVAVFDDDGDELGKTRSDAEGRFRIAHLPIDEEDLTIAVRAEGYGAREAHLPVLTADRAAWLPIELKIGRSIRVHCRSSNGEPVRGAQIVVESLPRIVPTAFTDVRGDAVLRDLPATTIELAVRADGYAAECATIAGTGLRPAELEREATIDLSVRLDPGASVRGVVDGPGGPSVATVRFVRADAHAERATARWGSSDDAECATSPDGAFECRDLRPGLLYRIIVERSGCAPWVSHEPFVVSGGASVDLGTIAVVAGRRIAGRVVDAEGNAVSGAQVSISANLADGWYQPSLRVAQTDHAGRFEMQGVPPASVRISATWNGLRGTTEASESTSSVEVLVTQPTPGRLRGRCTSMDGEPMGGVELAIRPRPGPPSSVIRAISDVDGTFTVDPFPSMYCTIALVPPTTHVLGHAADVEFSVFEPAEVTIVAARTLTASVRAPDGVVLDDIAFEWTGVGSSERSGPALRGRVDPASGCVRMLVPARRDGAITAVGSGILHRAWPIAAGDGPLDLGSIVLDSALRVAVACTAVDGAPVARVPMIVRATGEPRIERAAGITDSTGALWIDLERDREWQVCASWAGRVYTKSVPSASPDVVRLEFAELPPPVAVRVVVSDRGQRAAGARVELRTGSTSEVYVSTTDANGTADFLDVSPGSLAIEARSADTAIASKYVTIPGGQTSALVELSRD
jgi:hypothetical protein